MKPRNVNLLVCLNPSSTESINELTFYKLVRPITEVLNLRVVSTDGQWKAFVQVKDENESNVLIESLHNKTLPIGKVKVFVSHKKFVNYGQTLSQMFKSMIDEKNQDKSLRNNENSGNESEKLINYKAEFIDNMKLTYGEDIKKNKNDFCNNESSLNEWSIINSLIKKSGSSNLKSLNSNTDNNVKSKRKRKVHKIPKDIEDSLSHLTIRITHDDLVMLRSKLVSQYFSQFGHIVKKVLDQARSVWTIQYDSEVSVSKAISVLSSTSFMEYKIIDPANRFHEYKHNSFQSIEKAINKSLINVTLIKGKIADPQDVSASPVLTVTDPSQRVNLVILCRLVAMQYMPIKICEAYDIDRNMFFYILEFNNSNEASDVYKFLNEQNTGSSNLEIKFVNVFLSNNK